MSVLASPTLRLLTAGEAQRLTQRIKLTAGSVREGMFKLRNLVDEAKGSNVWQVLGFASWTAYLADTLGDEPMRLGREERQELVGYLAGEGLSTRAIAPIVGASPAQVKRDVRGGSNEPPEAPVVASTSTVPDDLPRQGVAVVESPAPTATETTITGLDGKTYTRPTAPSPRRRPITDQARDLGWDIRKQADRLARLREDDRLPRNKEEVAALLRGHLMFVIDSCQGFLDDLDQSQED